MALVSIIKLIILILFYRNCETKWKISNKKLFPYFEIIINELFSLVILFKFSTHPRKTK